jgi:hypothetical protein
LLIFFESNQPLRGLAGWQADLEKHQARFLQAYEELFERHKGSEGMSEVSLKIL